MSVTPSSTVVGVFRDRALAEQAMEALSHAGFEREQIRYLASGASGNFFEDIKSLFTGSGDTGGNAANDLSGMGLSDEEVHYYTNERSNGNTILMVKAPGREQEAQSIMHQYGSYNAQMGSHSSPETTNYAPQSSSNYAQQGSSYEPPEQHYRTQDRDAREAQTQPQGEHPFQGHQEDTMTTGTPESDLTSQTTQPMTARNTSYPHMAQTAQVPSEHDREDQGERPIPTEHSSEHRNEQPVTTAYNSESQSTHPVVNASGYAPQSQVAQANVVTSEDTDEFQQLQAKFAALQQQLQNTRAQLQAAKEREAQLQATKERERQRQAMKQQLQELQAELEATQAELKETHTRLQQYQ